MKIETPVYIVPDKGETIFGISKDIEKAIKDGKIGSRIYFVLPDGKEIRIQGTTHIEIRDSIATQWAGSSEF